jgi:alkylhydroperoxidase/carboxymuconolactone decarboxylase family protein YurZ
VRDRVVQQRTQPCGAGDALPGTSRIAAPFLHREREIAVAASSFKGDPDDAREESDGDMTAMDRRGDEAGPGGPSADRLRALASTWEQAGSPRLDTSPYGLRSCALDGRTEALVRLAALVAMRAPTTAYRDTVEAALDGGAREEEVIGTLIAVAGTVGLSRLVSATVALGLALGYDIDAALEELDPSVGSSASHSGADDGA